MAKYIHDGESANKVESEEFELNLVSTEEVEDVLTTEVEMEEENEVPTVANEVELEATLEADESPATDPETTEDVVLDEEEAVDEFGDF